MTLRLSQLLLFISLSLTLAAQDTVLSPESESDSMNYNKVMVIPYDPRLFLSDCTHDLIKHNKMEGEEVSKRFRYGLDYNINARILSKYETYHMLRDTSVDAQKDLQAIYRGIGYKYETPLRPDEEEKKKKGISNIIDNLKAKFQKKDEIQSDNSLEARQATSYRKEEKEPKQYFNTKIHNVEMLTYLNEKYGTDLFLFINQFELKTNYDRCIDRANGVFEREALIHFSIFNKYGEQLYGDVVTVIFPSNSNDLDVIIRSNFPLVADFLSEKLPIPKKINEEIVTEEAIDDN